MKLLAVLLSVNCLDNCQIVSKVLVLENNENIHWILALL